MKIMAIGGGNNSNINKKGLKKVYEHGPIDREIITLSNKSKPNILFISHASSEEDEIPNYNKIVNTYGKMYDCDTKLLSIDMLVDSSSTKELVEWADVIYAGGGNTRKMMELWKKYSFDHLLRSHLDDKVFCGTSAGASCWFSYACSDYLKMESQNMSAPFAMVEGMHMVDLILNPHANDEERMIGLKELLKESSINGLSLSNNMAIEIVDEEYKLVSGNPSSNENVFAELNYWKDGKYYREPISEKGLVKQLVMHK